MRKNIFAKAFILLVPVFLLCACAKGYGEAPSVAPDISLRDMNGNTVKLSDFKGKVIILDFFATWCPPCRQEIPDFIALQKQHAEQGFVMIGVSLTPQEDVKPFAEKLGMNYTILIGDDKANAAYGPIRSIPTTFIIDKKFNIVKKYIGYRPKDTFENDIGELLSK
ncbi:MAG: TlpA disulfide reductase family protein [Candidatus Omnitrophica bacterium]|nr:TlpA disulfide reductase family protein [Candidatus Omnitrophota bacterium]